VSDDTDNNWRLGSLEWIAVGQICLGRTDSWVCPTRFGRCGLGCDFGTVFMGTQVVAGIVRVQVKREYGKCSKSSRIY
jgi:hypothetical protein